MVLTLDILKIHYNMLYNIDSLLLCSHLYSFYVYLSFLNEELLLEENDFSLEYKKDYSDIFASK